MDYRKESQHARAKESFLALAQFIKNSAVPLSKNLHQKKSDYIHVMKREENRHTSEILYAMKNEVVGVCSSK